MYLCKVCGVCSAPKQKRLLHIIYKLVPKFPSARDPSNWRRDISQEIPVCGSCKSLLDRGVPLKDLLEYNEVEEEVVTRVEKAIPTQTFSHLAALLNPVR